MQQKWSELGFDCHQVKTRPFLVVVRLIKQGTKKRKEKQTSNKTKKEEKTL